MDEYPAAGGFMTGCPEKAGQEVEPGPQNCVLGPRETNAILDASPVGIAILKNRVIQWTNRIFCTMLGYEYQGLDQVETRIFYSDSLEYQRVGQALYGKPDRFGNGFVETVWQRRDGGAFDCRIRASRLAGQKTDAAVVIMVTDISELKLLQVQLQQAQKMEAIGILAGGISHDFNNILMGIQGHLSLMQIDVTDSEKVRNHATHINRLVKTAAELTSRLLGFARGGKYQIATVEVRELVTATLGMFAHTRKDLDIQECYADDIKSVDADPSQMEQVFLNLFINAAQAMPEQGKLTIAADNLRVGQDHDYPFAVKTGDYVQISISDTGGGMDLETQKKIFDPFFSTKEAGDKKGRGLGLSTVFGIVKNHGGFILVESRKGEGATFRVCLPASAQPGQAAEPEKTVRTADPLQKGTETILLVDDEDEVINVGKNFLEKLGYKAIIARNGLEAVEIFKLYRDEISLVILDLIMPRMSGKQAFAEIKEIQADARVLISTGYTVDETIEGFLNQGCHGFIRKPFSINEFAAALRSILDKEAC